MTRVGRAYSMPSLANNIPSPQFRGIGELTNGATKLKLCSYIQAAIRDIRSDISKPNRKTGSLAESVTVVP